MLLSDQRAEGLRGLLRNDENASRKNRHPIQYFSSSVEKIQNRLAGDNLWIERKKVRLHNSFPLPAGSAGRDGFAMPSIEAGSRTS